MPCWTKSPRWSNVPTCWSARLRTAFLDVPQECLILTMKANQKYFPLLDAAGKLTNQFLIVSNISPADASAVIQGNERVVRPRLADAKFFFDQDRKKTLETACRAGQGGVSQQARQPGRAGERVRAIARGVGRKIGRGSLCRPIGGATRQGRSADRHGRRVSRNCRASWARYYARHDGEDETVAQAIDDQYLVRRDETEDVSNLVSEVLQMADRMETLVGIWGIGLKPTGDKDPFALRRHALSIIKSFQLLGAMFAIDGAGLKLAVDELIEFSLSVFPSGVLGEQRG